MHPSAMNFGRFVTQIARRLPDRPGPIQGNRRWSCQQIDARVDAMVGAPRVRGAGAA